MMKRRIRIGTRESKLAIVQSNLVIYEIKKKFPDYEFELIGFKTQGDLLLDEKLDKIGGKGLFIKELENALLNHTIDMAVHSMKDMPAELPEGLTIAAVSKREDPRDALISWDGKTLDQLESQAVVGTSSVRREVQLQQLRHDLVMKTLRGNVPTRINKLENREYDAIILAMAGLKRLGLENKCVQCFEIDQMIPAVGQGVLGIETRKGEDVEYLLESIHDEEAFLAVSAERAYLLKLNGNCSTPIAAHAVIEGNRMKVYGFLASEDKTETCRDWIEGGKHDAASLGEKLAERILRNM
jgi:hydroxymethylbilane synthase